jgi:uncharacterized protein YecE (DUF72 family)
MIRVGTAGWSYADWEGRVYPRRKPRGFHPLAFLSRFVDCVEVNSSFYALPDPRHVEAWRRMVEPRAEFRFTAKLWGALTHEAETDVAAGCARFLSAFEPMEQAGVLGAVLAQFPLSFRDEAANRARLQRLAQGLSRLPLAIELRHPSWFGGDAPAFLASLAGGALVEIDLPDPPAGSHVRHAPREVPLVGSLGYLRLHGRNTATWFDPAAGRDRKYDYLYGEAEVAELAARARRIAQGRDETYVITNNHFGGQALANAIELRALLGGRSVAAPSELLHSFPHLHACARAQGQRELF